MKNYLLLALFVLLFSCSTNKIPSPQPVTFNPATSDLVDGTLTPNKRYIVEKSMEAYKPLAVRAESFFELVSSDSSLISKNTFTHTIDTKDIVIAKIRAAEYEIVVPVAIYYPKWYQSNVVTAYREGNKINFNANRMNRGDCSLINTFVHEYLHALGYDHRSAKDLTSVPYAVGDMAEELCKKGRI